MDQLTKYLDIILATIRQAGDTIAKDYENRNNLRARMKQPRDLVTAADIKSEKIIIGAIKKNFPGQQILSEESGLTGKPSDYLWIIDPLDGTTNFFMHNPLWSVSIALAYKGEIMIGATYAPMQGELFHAVLGQGAYLNGRKIVVDDSLIKPLNAFCHGRETGNIRRMLKYFEYQKLHSLDCRQLGSAAIEMAYVAAGRLSSLMIPGGWPWDIAAGALLVREAGGKITDFSGEDWNLKERDVLAAAPQAHGKILKIIKKIKI